MALGTRQPASPKANARLGRQISCSAVPHLPPLREGEPALVDLTRKCRFDPRLPSAHPRCSHLLDHSLPTYLPPCVANHLGTCWPNLGENIIISPTTSSPSTFPQPSNCRGHGIGPSWRVAAKTRVGEPTGVQFITHSVTHAVHCSINTTIKRLP